MEKFEIATLMSKGKMVVASYSNSQQYGSLGTSTDMRQANP